MNNSQLSQFHLFPRSYLASQFCSHFVTLFTEILQPSFTLFINKHKPAHTHTQSEAGRREIKIQNLVYIEIH